MEQFQTNSKEQKHNQHKHNQHKQQEKNNENQETEKDFEYIHGLESKVIDYIQTAQRLQAEFENYRKHSQEQINQSKMDGKIDAIRELIPVLDSFANAKKMVTDEKMLEGFNLIETQIVNAFKNMGVEKIDTKNQHFDPTLHNALAVQNNDELDNDIIIDEYQAGYKIKDKIIRYSQVIVNKKEEK